MKDIHSFRNGGKMYHVALIDYLQTWDCNKKAERCFKTILGRNRSMMSCIPPKPYGDRFIKFMYKSVFI